MLPSASGCPCKTANMAQIDAGARTSPATAAAGVVLPMSGIAKCIKAAGTNMTFSASSKQALHDAALVFLSFAASRYGARRCQLPQLAAAHA